MCVLPQVDRILGRVRDSGLMPPEYMSATGQQPAAAQRQADAAAAAGAASSAAGAAAGGKPALDAKALAKQRQVKRLSLLTVRTYRSCM